MLLETANAICRRSALENFLTNLPAVIESRKIQVIGHNVHYLKTGCGLPVILLHGGASNARDWINTMTFLSEHYTVYAPDVIGFGLSERRQDGYYLSDFSNFLTHFMDELELRSAVLVGHSLGGRISLEIAAQYPERVNKLVLVDTAGLGKASFFGNALLTFFWALRQVLHQPQPFPKLLAKPGEEKEWLCINQLPNIQVPTCIVWKRHDPYFPVALARRAHKLMPGARLEIIPGYGHAPHGQNGDAFNRLLLDFIENG
jgi:4,5:9,10-diseco-3-hydroxy-5,9,17-trioxoandrosta-1(10),2-diene-4-oate hydrolase